jgi:hypothetical protein
LAAADANVSDLPGLGSEDFVLHLHSFKEEDSFTAFHLVAGTDKNFGYCLASARLSFGRQP